jgi:TRAP-type C4-dicarboxylate transport system substrate-binding protein
VKGKTTFSEEVQVMKKDVNETLIKALVCICLVSILSLVPSLTFAQSSKVIKLSCSNYLPAQHPVSKTTGDFCKEMGKRTNGRIKIAFYAGGQLLGPVDMYDGVIKGITDIGFSAIHYNRARFPLSEIFTCPLGFWDNWIGAKVFTDFYNEYDLKEWDETHPLLFSSAAPTTIQTVKKKITTMQDLKGQVIRAAGPDAEIISALGGTPRVLPIGELYDSMAKGVIDGAKISIETAKVFRFAEVCKYVTFAPQISGASVFYLVINKNKWNDLPKDVQQIFAEVSKKYEDEYAMTYNKGDIAGKKFFLGIKGNEYYELPSSEAAKWVEKVKPVTEKYINQMKEKGFSEELLRKKLNFLRERIDYWTMKSKELNIPSIIR